MSNVRRGPNYRPLKEKDLFGHKLVEVNGQRKAVVPLNSLGPILTSKGTRHVPTSTGGRPIGMRGQLNDFH